MKNSLNSRLNFLSKILNLFCSFPTKKNQNKLQIDTPTFLFLVDSCITIQQYIDDEISEETRKLDE